MAVPTDQKPDLRAALAMTSTEDLLDAVIELTHAIHGASSRDKRAALRDQRAIARMEILRRATR
jgi:hypothetical protein